MSWEPEVIAREFPDAMHAVQMGTGERRRYVPERTCKREKHGTKIDGSPKLRCSLCEYGIGDKRWKFCPNCGAKVEGVDE